MFGGSPDRSRVSNAQGHMGARLFGIELPARPIPKVAAQQAAELKRAALAEEAEGRTLGVMPVVDAGILYFQDGANVHAVGLDSGIPLPGWVRTLGVKGIYHLRGAVTLRNQQYTLTLTETAILGVLGLSTRAQMAYANQGAEAFAGDAGTRLVCLDRETGRERWVASPASLGGDLKDDERERLKALDLSGSPVVVGDSVYVIGRGGKDVQFENCYLICLDLNSGKYRWSTLIASSNTNFNPYAGDPAQSGGTTSHIAYASGRLYVSTNLGAVAAVDAGNGSIIWLSLYPRDESNLVNDGPVFRGRRRMIIPQSQANGARPWELNPVIVREGKLFFMPSDGNLLLVYNAADGQEIKRFDLTDISSPEGLVDRPAALVGLVDNWVVLTSPRRTYLIDWVKYDVAKAESFASNRDRGAASVSLKLGSAVDAAVNGGVRGRAFVTKDSVYVPTDRNLYQFSIQKGLFITNLYPRLKVWDDKEGPGNVVVTGEHVVIAGKSSVDVYTDMALARAKLDRELAAAPDDPDARLHYAEVMLAAGQSAVSLAKMQEAAGLLGGAPMRSGAGRQRLFNDSLTFAEKLAKEQQAASVEAAIQFYDLAAKAADLPAEQVSYRLSRARFARDNVQDDSFAMAVKLYQEILEKPEWRGVEVQSVNDAQGDLRGLSEAGREATAQIADLIRQHPEAYEAVAARATAAAEAAKAAGDPVELLRVAEVYPNAPAASGAMLQAADVYEQKGNPRLAAHVLRQVFQKYGNTPAKGAIVEALVRNYLRVPGGFDIAAARLRREKAFADTRLTHALVLPDGSKIEDVTFGEAAAQLAAARPKDPPVVYPDVHVPTVFERFTPDEQLAGKKAKRPFFPLDDPAQSPVIPEVTQLIQAPVEMPDAVRPDRVAVVINNHVTLFAPGGTKPLGVNPTAAGEAKTGVWTRNSKNESVLADVEQRTGLRAGR